MSEATFRISTVHPDADSVGTVPDLVKPHPTLVRASYAVEAAGEALVEHEAAADTEIALDLGDIAEVIAFVLENKTGQDLSVAINGKTDGGSTEVHEAVTDLDGAVDDATAATTALEAELLAQVTILEAFDDEDDIEVVIAAIATAVAALATLRSDATTAATALDAARDALVTADDESGAPIFTLPDGAVLAYAAPDGAGTPIESISLLTTDEQVGDRVVAFKAFGEEAA